MNDVMPTLKSRRNELSLDSDALTRPSRFSQTAAVASANGKVTRVGVSKPMSAAMKAKIGRGVRKAFLQRKREAAPKAKG